MKLRHRFYLYLALAHTLFAGVAAFVFAADRRWLLAAEALLVLSMGLGVWLVRRFFGTLELIQTGSEFIAERDFSSHFSLTGQAELDQLVGIYNTMIDQLRQERQRLQEQHYFLHQVVTASPLGVVTLDFDGRLDLVNPAAARLLQQEATALGGRTLKEVGSPFTMALGDLAVGESRILNIGGWRRLKCHRAQFFDRGFPRQVLLLEELTDELRQSEKASYEKLIRLMSHEVNNTVAATASLLESCLSYAPQLGPEDRPDFEMALRAVMDRSTELSTFMRAYSDVVRLPQPTVRSCDLPALLEDIHVLFSAELAQRRISWTAEFAEGRRAVKLDRGQMERVLINIVRNALDSMGSDGALTARLFTDSDKSLTLVLADTGPGIPPEAAQRLFTPFFSTKPNGQGIGLTLVREILEGHRFPFALESRPQGLTEFTIRFPADSGP